MTQDDTETNNCSEESSEKVGDVSRRAVLSSLGTGAATLGLGGAAGTAAAEDPGDSPAASFAGEMGDATSATGSGAWSDSSVWDSGRPGEEADARIGPDASVTIKGETEPIKTLVVEGDLSFATDTDTHLRAETIITTPGSSLEIGTENEPIQPDAEAHITIVHHEDISEKEYDPKRISKGIITMGELEIHGADKTSWDELASAPTAGDTSIKLSSAPTNWNEGDEIVIPGLAPNENEDEERTIAGVSGSTVTLDAALEHDHVPPENKLDVDLTAYALNLSRNVVIESEVKERDPEKEKRINRQGHMMVMQPAQSLHNFRTIHLGRTNKDFKFDKQPIDEGSLHGDEPNPKSRYSVHFHRTGIGEEPHKVSGVVAQNSPGWGIVNHHSHANVRDSITYQVFGAGFTAESGPERGEFKRCFALRSRGSDFGTHLQTRVGHEDFGHEGHGFWFHGPGVAMEDCVAAGHDKYAYAMYGEMLDPGHNSGNYPNELAIEDGLLPEDADPDGTSKSKYLPFKSFTRNTAFASGGGLDYVEFDGRSEVGWSVVDTFTVYNIYAFGGYGRYGGNRAGEGGKCAVTQRYADFLHVKNPQFCNKDDGSGNGVIRNFYPRTGKIEGGVIEGFSVGIKTLAMKTETIEGVTFYDNGSDIYNYPLGDNDLTVHIENCDFSVESGVGINLNHDWHHIHPYQMTDPSLTITLDGKAVYLQEQNPDYVPFNNAGEIDRIKGEHQLRGVFGVPDMETLKSEIPGKTNAELQAEYGQCMYGELTPPVAQSHPGVHGGTVGGSNEPHSGDVSVDPAPMAGESVTAEVTGVSDADYSIDRTIWLYKDGQRSTGESMTTSFDEPGDYEITAQIIYDDGASKQVTETVGVVDELQPATNPGPVSSGVTYDVSDRRYPGTGGSGVHDQINLGAVGGGPYEEDITYEGYVQVPEDGGYRFTLEVNERANLYIDGEKVTGAQEGYDTHNTATEHIGLEAGLHSIRVEYGETAGGQDLEVRLGGGGMSGEIPADALYHEDEDGEVISDLPQVAFSTTNESGTTVSFDASASKATEGSITSYEWEFGDGTSASGETVEHSYDTGGFYNVTLTVTDDEGRTGVETKEVEVGETHEIRINAQSGQETNYELSVSGTLKKGERANGSDTVEGSTASGVLGGGTDSYHYGGEITSWALSKDIPLKITIDGEEVDPSTLGDGSTERHKIVIDGLDGQVSDYEFSVDGAVQKGKHATDHDDVEGNTVSGTIVAGKDSYHYDGEITDFSMEKDIPIKVEIDGEEVDPSKLGAGVGEFHEIVINGLDDQSSDYELSASGSIHKGQDASRVDSIGDGTVSAAIGGAQDNYYYEDEITSWSLAKDIPVKITIDGEEVDPSTLGQSGDPGGSDADKSQSPYKRTTGWPLPGRVQAEDFDAGGPDVAYADESTGNIGGEYRDTQVDIQAMPNSEDNYNLGWMHVGEWLEYTVKVESEGTYDLTLNVASPQSGTVKLKIRIGDTDVGPVTVPQTGGWNNYETVTVSGVQLAAGEQVFRIDVVNTGGNEYGCDIDWFEVTESDQESIPQAIDADDDGIIEDKEILNGLSHWQSGEPVPNTGGQTVTDEAVLELVKMWKEETDVMKGD